MNKQISENGIWIIGDVHGEYEKLKNLISKLPKNAQICFVGDLIDRGPDSAHIVEFVIQNNYLCVLGNHEQMMIEACNQNEDAQLQMESWQINGGIQALSSYKRFSEKLLRAHVGWAQNLPYYIYFEAQNYKPLVVSHSYIHHVWVNKDYNYELDEVEDVLWRHMHNKKLFDSALEEKNNIFNIFGHSPVSEPIVTDSYAMIDTGATYKKKKFGKLTAMHYPSLLIKQSSVV